MAIPSSGPLTFSAIQTEFGGSNPIGLNEYYAGGANVPAGTSGTYGAVPSSGTISVRNFYGTSDITPAGQIEYTRSISSGPTTLSWTCPVGVTSVSVLIIAWGRNGGTAAFTCCNWRGGVGGPGGGLVYINNLSVTPGNSYTLGFADPAQNDRFYFGTQANGYAQQGSNPGSGGTQNISGGLGVGGSGRGQGGTGRFSGSGGGSPSNANGGGGGGGPGYSPIPSFNDDGRGGSTRGSGNAGGASPRSGGGGGAGSESGYNNGGGAAGGGGTGALGLGSPGAGGTWSDPTSNGGAGGSGGTAGGTVSSYVTQKTGGAGGNYGAGGGGGGGSGGTGGAGGQAIIRIIWAGGTGITREYPSTNTGNL